MKKKRPVTAASKLVPRKCAVPRDYGAVTVDDIAASLATLETMLHGVIYGDQRADVYIYAASDY